LEHGISGWRLFFPEFGGMIHPLPFNFWRGELSLEKKEIAFPKVYSGKSFYQEIKLPSFSVARKKFVKSSFTMETQGGATMVSFDTFDNLLNRTKQVCKKQGKKFVFTYWNDFDSIAHRNGANSDALKKHFIEIDRKIEKLRNDLKNTGTKLLITADHGHLDSKYIFLGKDKKLMDCLAIPLCGEVRFAYCYVKPEKEREFKDILKNKYQKYLTCYKSSDLVKKGMFGLFDQHEKFSERIGNYTLILKDNFALSDFFVLVNEKEFFKSNHGGLSKEEMFVPLISIDC
jgi:predicted AlkP superfamily pyrophosphatase or phosphodiesterase